MTGRITSCIAESSQPQSATPRTRQIPHEKVETSRDSRVQGHLQIVPAQAGLIPGFGFSEVPYQKRG